MSESDRLLDLAEKQHDRVQRIRDARLYGIRIAAAALAILGIPRLWPLWVTLLLGVAVVVAASANELKFRERLHIEERAQSAVRALLHDALPMLHEREKWTVFEAFVVRTRMSRLPA